MKDSCLLACPEWQTLTDTHLKQAIQQAKRRAVQTFALMVARQEECGVILPLASAELYARHCILTTKEGAARMKEWDERRIIDWCEDPRVYHFCTLYDRKWRAHTGFPSVAPSSLLLRERVNYAYAQVNKAQSLTTHAMLVAALAPSEDRTQHERELLQKQCLLNAALKMAMLVTMQFNAYMEKFVSR